MKIYNKKSDILENLGKDKKDTKYLDRAIERGEILNEGGYYIKKDDLLAEAMKILIVENNQLRDKVESFSEKQEKIEELETNVEYYEKENNELRDKNVALESILDGLREKGVDIHFGTD